MDNIWNSIPTVGFPLEKLGKKKKVFNTKSLTDIISLPGCIKLVLAETIIVGNA